VLYDPERHEPLIESRWDEAAARACIEGIMRDAAQRYSPENFWPTHPQDAKSPDPQFNLYLGVEGVIWALNHLTPHYPSIELPDFAAALERMLEKNRGALEAPPGENPAYENGLLVARTGILLLYARMVRLGDVEKYLAGAIDANQDNPFLEYMWGSPGTMVASQWLHEWTDDEKWVEEFRRDAAILWKRREPVEAAGCHLWVQHLYGHKAPYLGAVHGYAGCAFAILRGLKLLAPAEQVQWTEWLAESLRKTATWEDDCANWVPAIGPDRTATMMQICHGAPGMVIGLADFPDGRIDDLLIAGAETTWRAGPLKKGPGLCHGTGGNGYAFLKLYKRTGDAMWLDRARRFAMHAIAQHERDTKQYGQQRYSLWTGDAGLAVYLHNCIEATDHFPTMDVF
jgi:hypothetical protein